jgi:16S rRNA processing protein RimM
LQLIGCKAYLVDGDLVGEVTDVLNLPGQDVLSIKTESGEILIPFVHQLVPVVDIKAKRMTVIPPDFYESEASR